MLCWLETRENLRKHETQPSGLCVRFSLAPERNIDALRCAFAARWRSAAYQLEWRQLRQQSESDRPGRASERADNGPLRGNPGSVLICVTVHNDNEAKVQQTAASAVNQRAAARLHVESLGFTVEKHTREATGRSVTGREWTFINKQCIVQLIISILAHGHGEGQVLGHGHFVPSWLAWI